MALQERLQQVFVTALNLEPDVAVAQLEQRRDAGWDSVGHMALVVAIEDEFGVEFGPDDVIGMDSFSAAVQTLGRLGVTD